MTRNKLKSGQKGETNEKTKSPPVGRQSVVRRNQSSKGTNSDSNKSSSIVIEENEENQTEISPTASLLNPPANEETADTSGNVPQESEVEDNIEGETDPEDESEEEITEDSMAEAAEELFRLREKYLNCALHRETMQKYVQESLLPLGLKIEKEAQTCIRSQNFKRRWKEILNTAASDLLKALAEGYKEEMELLDEESAAVRETMKKALTDEDLAEYDSISKEALEKKETEIRKIKEKNSKETEFWREKKQQLSRAERNEPLPRLLRLE